MTTNPTKRLYLTSQSASGLWHYIGDPMHPNTTLDTGLVAATPEEMCVDEFGVYVTRAFV